MLFRSRGGTDPVLGSTPDFTFRIAKATGTSAVEGSKEREFDDAAMAAATRVEPVLATLYAEAFLDPENSSRGIYDAVWTVFDADALRFLAGKAGADRIMLGSDMPFPIGDMQPCAVVEKADLTGTERDAILGGTAQKVFRVRGH